MPGGVPDGFTLARAVEVLRAGGVVAFPTETVYGLCADASNREAVRRLYDVKGRDAGKASAFLLADRDAAETHAAPLPWIARRLADRFWPGPLTLVVPGRDEEWVGLRLPASGLPRALAAAAGVPLLQTSANRSGEAPALNAAAVEAALGDGVDLVLDGGRAPGGVSSTVVRVGPASWEVLREGAIPKADLVKAATRLLLVACTGNLCRSPLAAALLRRDLAEAIGCRPTQLTAHGFRIGSFGTMAMPGQPATDHTRTVALEMGLDLSRHRSRPWSIGLLEEADTVYCLTTAHREFLVPYFEKRPDSLKLLHPKGKDIHDPYGRSLRVYRKTGERMAGATEERAKELSEEARDGGSTG